LHNDFGLKHKEQCDVKNWIEKQIYKRGFIILVINSYLKQVIWDNQRKFSILLTISDFKNTISTTFFKPEKP
jgi:hypothetical protein